jgi:hypothetical protein
VAHRSPAPSTKLANALDVELSIVRGHLELDRVLAYSGYCRVGIDETGQTHVLSHLRYEPMLDACWVHDLRSVAWVSSPSCETCLEWWADGGLRELLISMILTPPANGQYATLDKVEDWGRELMWAIRAGYIGVDDAREAYDAYREWRKSVS